MTELADCRGIWAAMKSGRPVTLEDLQMIADVLPADSIDYLEPLIRNEYVSIAGVKRASSGEALPVFKLVKRTGPDAPYLKEDGKFVDPNLEARKKDRKPYEKSEMPTPRAKVRFAAERFPGGFTRTELRETMGMSSTPEWCRIWVRMMTAGEIVRDEILKGQYFRYIGSATIDRLREYFRANLGREVLAAELSSHLQRDLRNSTIRMALDLLAAEGFRLTLGRTGQNATYKVESPARSGQPNVHRRTSRARTIESAP